MNAGSVAAAGLESADVSANSAEEAGPRLGSPTHHLTLLWRCSGGVSESHQL